MTSSPQPAAFVGSIPRNYDSYLGPFLFEDYAADLAARLASRLADRSGSESPRGSVLETACGTGISTRFLRRSLPAEIQIVATDFSEAMLEHARGRHADLGGVRFEQADAVDLPFEDASFDALCCQFGLMFLPDKLAAMRAARRVLRPGGQLALNVWGSLDTNPYVQVAQDAIASCFDTEPPTFLYQPWSFSDPDALEALLAEAGFTSLSLQLVSRTNEGSTARQIARGFVRGTPTIQAVQERALAPVDAVVETVARALSEAFGCALDAPLQVPMQALVATARRAD